MYGTCKYTSHVYMCAIGYVYRTFPISPRLNNVFALRKNAGVVYYLLCTYFEAFGVVRDRRK